MINAGKNLMIGLWNGIVSGFDSLIGDVESIPSDIVNVFKSAFGIASPSKVFREIGQNVAAGFAGGVDAGTQQVGSAMQRMTSAVTAGAPRSAGSLAAGGAGGGQSTLVIQPGAGGSGLEAQFWVWLKNGVRQQGGDPAMFQRKVAFA